MKTSPVIAVLGNKYFMPADFPLNRAENAGNIVHAIVPMELFPSAVHAGDPKKPWKPLEFAEWANSKASHLILTLANTIRLSRTDLPTPKYEFINGIRRSLEKIARPKLVIFGLGSQAPTQDLSQLKAPDEVVDLMRYLGDRCEVIGVRGEFTKRAFEHFAGVKNTFVTGCPSVFSRPQAISRLHDNLKNGKKGAFVYSGTSYRRKEEREMLIRAVKERAFLVEPQNKENHQLYIDSLVGEGSARIPKYLESDVVAGRVTAAELTEYFGRFYRLFRGRAEWDNFNEEIAAFTYGTRFHVNVASILSGVPALWVTHDSRTQELAEFLHLPSLSLQQAYDKSPSELAEITDYSDFFSTIESKFANFNQYLSNFGLKAPVFRW